MLHVNGGAPRAFLTERASHSSYFVGHHILKDQRAWASFGKRPAVIIIDVKVAALYPDCIRSFEAQVENLGVLTLAAGESVKSLESLSTILGFLVDCGLPKHGCVIAIGGGTVCDVTAMAAALMRRGTPLILVPTTLLAQIDATIGGKNGINIGSHKNVAGQFHHAETVICDQVFLSTLSPREQICGAAEAIKVLALVEGGEQLASHSALLAAASMPQPGEVWTSLVQDSLNRKLDLLRDDPYEHSSRRLLNYGHAFAHLFEERSKYALAHGEAVLLGMMVENEISRCLGLAEDIESLHSLIIGLLNDYCRKYWVTYEFAVEEAQRLRLARRGHMNLVCMQRPGQAIIIDDIPDSILFKAWKRVEKQLQC